MSDQKDDVSSREFSGEQIEAERARLAAGSDDDVAEKQRYLLEREADILGLAAVMAPSAPSPAALTSSERYALRRGGWTHGPADGRWTRPPGENQRALFEGNPHELDEMRRAAAKFMRAQGPEEVPPDDRTPEEREASRARVKAWLERPEVKAMAAELDRPMQAFLAWHKSPRWQRLIQQGGEAPRDIARGAFLAGWRAHEEQGADRPEVNDRKGFRAETAPEPITPGTLFGVYSDIFAERYAQDRKWGGQKHDDAHDASEWIVFIQTKLDRAEEADDDADYRRRMVQVAALAVAAVESLDRQRAPGDASAPPVEKASPAPPDAEPAPPVNGVLPIPPMANTAPRSRRWTGAMRQRYLLLKWLGRQSPELGLSHADARDAMDYALRGLRFGVKGPVQPDASRLAFIAWLETQRPTVDGEELSPGLVSSACDLLRGASPGGDVTPGPGGETAPHHGDAGQGLDVEEQRLSRGGCTRLPREMLDALGLHDGDLVWFLRSTPGGRWEAWTSAELDEELCMGQDLGPAHIAARRAAVDAMPHHVASRLTAGEARRLAAKGWTASVVWVCDDHGEQHERFPDDLALLRGEAGGATTPNAGQGALEEAGD